MEQDNQITETTLRDYLRILFRHKTVMIMTVAVTCVTVIVGLKLKTNIYESSVKMLITAEKQVEATYLREMYGGHNAQQTLTQSEIVRSKPVIRRVVRALRLDQRPLKARLIDRQIRAFEKRTADLPEEQKAALLFRKAIDTLKNRITVEPIPNTNMFTINVRDYNPVGAALIANVVSRSYVIFDLEQQLAELKLKYGGKHPTVALIETSITRLEESLDGRPLDDVEAIGPASVKIMEQASPAITPTGTSKMVTLLLTLVISVFLAVMLAFIFEYADQTIKTPQDIRKFLDAPFIGSVARTRSGRDGLIRDAAPQSEYFQSYRGLADQICLLFKNEHMNSLLITSAAAREGSPRVVANAGYYLAETLQHRVLIIDANLRDAAMSRLLDGPGSGAEASGLAAYLEGRVPMETIIGKSGKGPDIIRAGATQKNPVTLLESDRMRALIKAAVEAYEIVLIDCANIRDYKDATVLSALVDGTALTVNEGTTRRQVVANACAQLREHGANVKGVILNNRTFPIPGFVYNNV